MISLLTQLSGVSFVVPRRAACGTPLRQNMVGAEQHNHWQLLVMRRTIETRFSELCALFDIEHTLTRSIRGLQLRIEQIILAYHLRYFEIN